MLKKIDFELEEAENGIQCMKKIPEFSPDLIFMDLVMPEMDGYEATRKIRENSLYNGIKIVAISASKLYGFDSQILRSGFDDYISKPFFHNDLLNILKKYLQLEWIYKENILYNNQTQREKKTVLPPLSIIEKLYELASEGNLRAIRKELEIIKNSDKDYEVFYNQVKNLSDAFEMENLKILLNKYIVKRET
jgi:CheY-like chemotaxis protein